MNSLIGSNECIEDLKMCLMESINLSKAFRRSLWHAHAHALHFFPNWNIHTLCKLQRIVSKMFSLFDKKTNDNSFDFVVLNVTEEGKKIEARSKWKKEESEDHQTITWTLKIGNMKKKLTSIIIHHIFAIPIVLPIESPGHFLLNSTSICLIQIFHPIIWAYVDMCERWHVSYYDLTIRNWVQIDDTFEGDLYTGLQWVNFNNKMPNTYKGHSTKFKYKAVRRFLFIINSQFWSIWIHFHFLLPIISHQIKALFIMEPNLLVKNTNTKEVEREKSASRLMLPLLCIHFS